LKLETFFESFAPLADAPNGVPKLRELILQLAVQGKLVPQDANDEPASVLLAKIKAEKERLIAEKKIRKSEPLPHVAADEVPFDIPINWELVRLGELGDWGSGSTPDRKTADYYGGIINWFKSGELNDGLISESEEKITEAALKDCSLRLNAPGDVLIAMYGATIGKLAILETVATTNQAVCACTCFSGYFNRFLFTTLRAFKTRFTDQGAGAAQPNISRVKIINTVAPLPPLAEQRRIVAKVDQLMALCDELEARQQRQQIARVKLNNAALEGLLTARAPAEFAEHWQRICDNFDLLYDAPATVAALRQAILQLAVQGKLVPQDAHDEPATFLLAKIKAEKERLIQEKKIKKSEPLPPIEADEVPFDLPQGWEWVRLSEAFDVRDGTHDTPKYVASGIPLVTSKNLYTGILDLSDVRFISTEDHNSISQRSNVEKLDILFAMIGSIGNPVIVDTDLSFSIKNVALFKYYRKDFSCPLFLRYFLLFASGQMKAESAGGVQSFVSLGYLRRYLFPLPPLAEQRRIVAKVDQLMALCDELEAKLRQAQTASAKLMTATVQHLAAA